MLWHCILFFWGGLAPYVIHSAAPNFDVALVKPHVARTIAGDWEKQEKLLDFVGPHNGGTRIILNAVSLRFAAAVAYGLPLGAPPPVTAQPWMSSAPWDIYAKTAGPCSADAQRTMLQRLLADRFGLQVSWDAKGRLHLVAGHRATLKYD
jgi:uncharacterized protein (TIGR03435 family)